MVISGFCAIACPHMMKPKVIAASAAHLTFLPSAPPAIRRNVKCKAALDSLFASVPLVRTFVRERAATGYERRNRDTRPSRRIIGPLPSRPWPPQRQRLYQNGARVLAKILLGTAPVGLRRLVQ